MGSFGPKQNNKTIGEHSEAILIAKLLEVGYGVLTPFGDNRRYDLVIEDADGNFHRVQCKTGRVAKDGAYMSLELQVHTTTQRQEERATEKEIIEDKLIILRYIVPL